MLRLLLIVAGLVILAFLIVRVGRGLAASRVDWAGIAFICAFVALAFFLRDTFDPG